MGDVRVQGGNKREFWVKSSWTHQHRSLTSEAHKSGCRQKYKNSYSRICYSPAGCGWSTLIASNSLALVTMSRCIERRMQPSRDWTASEPFLLHQSNRLCISQSSNVWKQYLLLSKQLDFHAFKRHVKTPSYLRSWCTTYNGGFTVHAYALLQRTQKKKMECVSYVHVDWPPKKNHTSLTSPSDLSFSDLYD